MFQSLATSENVETEMESKVEVFEHILNKASNIRGERSSKKSTPSWNTFELKPLVKKEQFLNTCNDLQINANTRYSEMVFGNG